MTLPHLVDADALIALTFTDHEHHRRAVDWVVTQPRFAVCPVVEGALVRFIVRAGESTDTAQAVVQGLRSLSPRCTFWPDTLSYDQVDLSHVTGHRQVTSAYLASLAAHHETRLATLDQGLASALPGLVTLIP